jgi:hypothetical protein
MADREKDPTMEPRPGETAEEERERVRSSNDRDQELEREGILTEHNQGYDQAVRTPRDED